MNLLNLSLQDINIFSFLLERDLEWCDLMNYFNPYEDPFKNILSEKIPIFDKPAYEQNPSYNFVYDKLFIMQSQGILSGKLEKIKTTYLDFPIFIKPRWGHKTSSSKNCIKINNITELNKYKNYKNMMWSPFIDAKEGMTDFLLKDGNIVHQVTYDYSNEQKGFTDVWKYISPENKPPIMATEWVQKYMKKYTGVVNVQYRDNIIIEVSLRFARGGAYINSTENEKLINNINNLVEKNEWDYCNDNEMKFKPFWSFKCFTSFPIIYLLPQHSLNKIMKKHEVKPFYEYYFEPSGKEGMVFLQFLHDDFDKGLKSKRSIETIFNYLQLCFYFLIFLGIAIFLINRWIGIIFLSIFVLVYLTRFLNPLTITHSLFKAQKQYFLNEASTEKLGKVINSI